jgi:hypothetical protein
MLIYISRVKKALGLAKRESEKTGEKVLSVSGEERGATATAMVARGEDHETDVVCCMLYVDTANTSTVPRL